MLRVPKSNILKGTYHAKCTFVRLLYMNVSPVCQRTHQVSENTTLSIFLHTQISKNGAATDLIQTDTDLKILWRQERGAPPIWPTLHLSGEWETARKRWRRCSTYARPVTGAVVCHKSRISPCKNRAGLEQIKLNEAWLKCMICLVFWKKNFTDMFYIGMALQYMFQI